MDPATPDRRARILVVSPNRAHLSLLARRLGEEGYRHCLAQTAGGAIAELHRGGADLVLAELKMPGMTGAELARAIRGETAWADLPIMLIAGRDEPTVAASAYAAGADDVIFKPFHFELLTARIERRLASARAVAGLRQDKAVLDARVVERAIEIGELKRRFHASGAERQTMAGMVQA